MSRHLLLTHHGGWHPSRPDHRRKLADTTGIKILDEVDPRNELPAVVDQLRLGSCTANADDCVFRYDGILDGNDPGELSRMDIYYQERKKEGALGQGDTGAFGSDGFWVAKNIGICAETDWPYDPQRYNDPAYYDPATPPAAAIADEKHYVLTKPYAKVSPTIQDIKAVLSNKQTIAFGFSVYESFESSAVSSTGVVPMPQQGERQLGGHETVIVGFLKSEPNYALGRNSWGTGWGISGYFLLPWAYITDTNYSGDWTTVQRPIAA